MSPPSPAFRDDSFGQASFGGAPFGGVPLVELVRNGLVEGGHHGHVVVIGADGAVLTARGDVAAPMYPRSCNKPMQAVGLLEAGFQSAGSTSIDTNRGEQLALATASHSGQPRHIAVVRSTLSDANLAEDELGCPPDLPLDEAAARAVLAGGGGPAPIFMNCSGKHAAMLSVCAGRGWSRADYLDPDHPLQRILAGTTADLAGEVIDTIGVDGCGAPLFAVSLTALARAFLRLASATDGAPHMVAAAMREHPDLVAGTGRTATRLMTEVPGLLAKDGAEGVWAAALPGGGAVAVKIDDGGMRAADRVVVAALRRLGIEAAVLDELAVAPLLGGTRRVGDVRIIAGAL